MEYSFKQIFFILLFISLTSAKEVAITIDDLPSPQLETIDVLRERYKSILKVLKYYDIHAVGFANVGNISHDCEIEIINLFKEWIKEGHELGNHTYSHKRLSRTTLDVFMKDVIQGEKFIKDLMEDYDLQLSYFRFPYLDNGFNEFLRSAAESALKNRGYTIAPVTIDTMDWKFNALLLKNPDKTEKILESYVQYIRFIIKFYEKASQILFKRQIKNIMLFHINKINSLVIDQILEILQKEYGYTFITLKKALEDPIYTVEGYCYNSMPGVIEGSWFLRWDKDRIIDWVAFNDKKVFFLNLNIK